MLNFNNGKFFHTLKNLKFKISNEYFLKFDK